MKKLPKGKYTFKIRLTALCAAVMLAAVSLSGCATSTAIAGGKDFDGIMAALKTDLFGSAEQDCQQLSLSLPVRAGFDPIEDKSAYASLSSDTLRSVYEEIERNLYQISTEADEDTGYYVMRYTRLPSELAFDDIYIVKEAVICDHPEAFWVLSRYDVRNNFHDGNYLVLYSKYSYDQINAAFAEINAATEQILARIPDRADEVERETIIHNALVDSITYDIAAAESDDSTADAFNLYGAMVKKQAVCSGYSYAAKMLLNRVGIESRIVVGMSKNSGHMWNQVKINGNWYHLDITWDDSLTESDVLYKRYNYFNLTDELIQRNHKIGKDFSEMVCEYGDDGSYTTAELYNFRLEPCTSLEENYHEKNAAHVSKMDSDDISTITNRIVDASKTKGEVVYILFDSGISNDDAETWLARRQNGNYSALEKSMLNANKYGIGARVRSFSLVRMFSDEEPVWPNLYAVRLIYA